MNNTNKTKNNAEDSFSERQDVAQVRNERSCPQSSGSPLEFSKMSDTELEDSLMNIMKWLVFEKKDFLGSTSSRFMNAIETLSDARHMLKSSGGCRYIYDDDFLMKRIRQHTWPEDQTIQK